jgi:toxin-antitoxin system PIN domain toxin
VRLIDVNVLLYVVNEDAVHHAVLLPWWERALRNEQPVAFSWIVLIGFLRLATSPLIFDRPLTVDEAVDRVGRWIDHPNTRILTESDRHWRILRDLLAEVGTAGNLTNDSHLAALAIEYGATLVSCDADFSRFPQLRWENPLKSSL